MRISEAFDEYRKIRIRGKGCSKNTDKAYFYTSKVVIRYFGDVNIRHVTSDKIASFYLELVNPESIRTSRVSRNTAREYVMKLRLVIGYCKNSGMWVENPDKICLPKPEKKFASFLTREEFEKFLKAMAESGRGYSEVNRERNVLIVKILFYTGLRIGELCALNRNSIKDGQCVIIGKSKEPRPCYFNTELQQDIDRFLSLRKDGEEALFIANETGKRVTPHNIEQVFRRVSKKSGVCKVTPHTLRHSFATQLIEHGVDIRYVAAFLGHQNLNTTRRYTHVRNMRLREIHEEVFGK